MYTGYFGRLAEYKNDGLVPIAICTYLPKWYDGASIIDLAPNKIFNDYRYGPHKGDTLYFSKQYNDVLNHLDISGIIQKLTAIESNIDKIILLCYEKTGEFCHRHLVAEWLSSNGYPCEEYSDFYNANNIWLF